MGPQRHRCAYLLVLCSAACGVPVDAPLLQVEAVEPERVEPGQVLRVEGAGFPVGREGELVLEGLARRPGATPRHVTYRLVARAISAEHLEASVSSGFIEATGGRATFSGSAQVVFPAANGGTVSGALTDLQLDVAPSAVTHLDEALLRRRRAVEAGRSLGLELDERGAAGSGVRVASVAAGSVADAAGLREHDRLVAMDGVRVGALGDCLPPPGANATAITILRPGTVAPVHLRLPIETEHVGPTPSMMLTAGLFGLVLLLLLAVGPGARAVSWLGRPVSGPGTLSWLLGATANDKPGRRALSLAATVLSVTLVFAGIAYAGRAAAGGLGVAVLLLAALTLRLLSGVGHGPVSLRARSATAARFLRDGLPTAAAVGAAAMLAGTGRADGLVDAQGFAPGQWLAFAHPAAFVALPAFVAVALGGGQEASASALGQLAGRAHLMVASGLGALLFLGGWAPPTNLPEPELVGLAAFALKAWALLWLGVRARLAQPGVPRWGAPLAFAALLAAGAWLATGATPEVATLGRPILLGGAGFVILGALVHRLRPDARPEPQVHALL